MSQIATNIKQSQMNNSQICTTPEQSKQLIKAGLNPDSADMILQEIISYTEENDALKYSGKYQPLIRRMGQVILKHQIPAWSLGKLWDLARGLFIAVESVESKHLFESLVNAVVNGGTSIL